MRPRRRVFVQIVIQSAISYSRFTEQVVLLVRLHRHIQYVKDAIDAQRFISCSDGSVWLGIAAEAVNQPKEEKPKVRRRVLHKQWIDEAKSGGICATQFSESQFNSRVVNRIDNSNTFMG